MRMRPLRCASFSFQAAISMGFAVAALAFVGCQIVVGIHDVQLDPGDTGDGGQGGHSDFAFNIGVAKVGIPYENNYVEVPVTVTAQGGFEGDVVVTPLGAPNDLIATALTIPAGKSDGVVQLQAKGSLVLGTSFELSLQATSGLLSRIAKVPAIVGGVPGQLDPRFGTHGVASWSLGTNGGTVTALLSTPEGKIIAGGTTLDATMVASMTGIRLLPEGGVDTTFGSSGRVSSAAKNASAEIRSVLLTPDGITLLTGWYDTTTAASSDVTMLRYKDDGTPEAMGSDMGKVVRDFGAHEYAWAAAFAPDQRILVTGRWGASFFVARFSDRFGTLDTTFAGNGWINPLPAGPTFARGNAVAVDAMNRALVAGFVTTNNTTDAVLVRLNASGLPDPTFGKEGVVQVALAGNQTAFALALQADGKIVVAAEDDGDAAASDAASPKPGFLVFRFTSSGSPDTSFGVGGTVTVPTSSNPGQVGMVLLPDGRIVVSGTSDGAELVRLLPDGTLDSSFGDAGLAAPNVGFQVKVNAIAEALDGNLLIGGTRAGKAAGVTEGFVARVFN